MSRSEREFFIAILPQLIIESQIELLFAIHVEVTIFYNSMFDNATGCEIFSCVISITFAIALCCRRAVQPLLTAPATSGDFSSLRYR